MKARLGCIPCFVKQGLSAVRLSTQDPAEQQRVLDEVLRRIQGLSLEPSPALLSPGWPAMFETPCGAKWKNLAKRAERAPARRAALQTFARLAIDVL